MPGVTPEAAILLARAQSTGTSILDRLDERQLRALFDVVANGCLPGWSLLDVGCAEHSTADLLVAAVEAFETWSELATASHVLMHPRSNVDVARAVAVAFQRLVPLVPSSADHLSISLLLALLIQTDSLNTDELQAIKEHSGELAQRIDELERSWREHRAREQKEQSGRQQRMLELVDDREALIADPILIADLDEVSPGLAELLLSRLTETELRTICDSLPPDAATRRRIASMLLGATHCPADVLDRIVGDSSVSLSEVLAVAGHPNCTPSVVDSLLPPVRDVIEAGELTSAGILGCLRALHRSPGFTRDHTARIRRWSDSVADLWDDNVAGPAEREESARLVLDLPTWLQPEVVRLMGEDGTISLAEALEHVARSN